jgi:MFS family permease
VPPAVRAVFAPSAVAVFVGFALLGVFTSVSPAFLGEYLGIDNRALVGLIVFAAFAGSASGQLLEGPVGAARSLTAGCWVLLAGMCCLAAALGAVSLPLLVCGAVVGGGGQGLSLRGSIDLVTAKAPAEDRAATVSALFLVAYTGISLPVVGIGVLAQFYGLRHAGLVFAVIMAVLATLAGIHLTRRHTVHPGG